MSTSTFMSGSPGWKVHYVQGPPDRTLLEGPGKNYDFGHLSPIVFRVPCRPRPAVPSRRLSAPHLPAVAHVAAGAPVGALEPVGPSVPGPHIPVYAPAPSPELTGLMKYSTW